MPPSNKSFLNLKLEHVHTTLYFIFIKQKKAGKLKLVTAGSTRFFICKIRISCQTTISLETLNFLNRYKKQTSSFIKDLVKNIMQICLFKKNIYHNFIEKISQSRNFLSFKIFINDTLIVMFCLLLISVISFAY